MKHAAGVLVALSGGDPIRWPCCWPYASGEANFTGRPVAAAHLNHQSCAVPMPTPIRSSAATCATRLDVPLFEHSADPRPVARSRGQGLEEAGRHLRRRFCEGLLADHADLPLDRHRTPP